ncbi:MAG: sn-glycerol-3-phosphate ABC transporter ATP-binding protein UgpC [Paracoccaceae bacterium]|nr:sn-glycerol-3-phosphate ABC transporter ATP-binding protein UgpC [Paracoccaceae bacterium]
MANVRVSGLVKHYGSVVALDQINLDIKDGEFIVFVGPSGSGKSTLLRCIAGLEPISEGTVRIAHEDVTDLDPADRDLSMVFQNYALFPHLSCRANLEFPLKTEGVGKSDIDKRVEQAAGLLHVLDLLNRKPSSLSGGQRQRVAIGRAIVKEPKVFLFDEPLSNLDAELRVRMRIEIVKLHRQLQNTIIYVTHDQVEAMTMADRIVVLRTGAIEQVGRPHELYYRPVNRFVASFIGAPQMNMLPCTHLAGDTISTTIRVGSHAESRLPVGPVRDDEKEGLVVGFRPEHISLARPDTEAIELEMAAEVIEHLGAVTNMYGTVETTSGKSEITVSQSGPVTLLEGQSSRIWIPVADCHLFNSNDNAIKRHVDPPAWK